MVAANKTIQTKTNQARSLSFVATNTSDGCGPVLLESEVVMKTKHYEFTGYEQIALRDALEHYWHNVAKTTNLNDVSPIRRKVLSTVEGLKDQFQDDVRLSR